MREFLTTGHNLSAHIGQQIEYGLQQWNFRNLWENFSRQKEKGLKRQTWGFPVTFSSHVSVLGFRWLSIPKKLLWSKIVTNVTKQAVIIPLIDCLLNSLLSMGDLENVQQFWSFLRVWHSAKTSSVMKQLPFFVILTLLKILLFKNELKRIKNRLK